MSMIIFAAVTAASLGSVDFPVSCSRPAQVEFNQAVALLHHMTYPQAREAFEHVASIDPHCAMAHWGVAMTLFQPLWPTRPGPEALARGWDEVVKARAQPTTERERLFVAATQAFFVDPAGRDYWSRIGSWEAAMKQLYDSFPDDAEAAAFYALAHLATSTAATTREHADRAAGILARVYAKNPQHPGAMHYLIHADDVPGREHEFPDITRTYSAVAPRNPHALHMPTHIYTRLGEWDAVIAGNLQAADAALEHPVGERGELVWDEFPHAIEYLVYAYLQKGMNDEAAIQLERLLTTANLEPTFKTAFHLASTQARYALERRAWNEAVLLEPRAGFAWPEAITHFARGVGAAHLGRLQDARAASSRLARLAATMHSAKEDLFASNIQILDLEVNAWIAHAEGRRQNAIELMQQAAALELTTPKHAVTPAPTLPAEEQLGDMLMDQGRTRDALAAYQRSLQLYPNRLNSARGTARVAH
jgi:tetratricopeptide (TPR) repeat protein